MKDTQAETGGTGMVTSKELMGETLIALNIAKARVEDVLAIMARNGDAQGVADATEQLGNIDVAIARRIETNWKRTVR